MERMTKKDTEAFDFFRCWEHKKYIENLLLFSVAPVLTGAKPSALVSLERCCKDVWSKQEQYIGQTVGLSVLELHESRSRFSVLIFDEAALLVRLNTPSAKNVLFSYGYSADANLAELLAHLKRRFGECRFPHEIGVFLGYPPEDVDAFIKKSGKDYLCSRYWKVYHNEEGARETFRFIDKAKNIEAADSTRMGRCRRFQLCELPCFLRRC